MELEELKSLWKSSDPDFQQKDEVEIASMLKRRSLSIVDTLKRSAWFELSITLILSIGLLVYAFYLPAGGLKWTSISILLMCQVYTFYYVKKLVLLNRFNPAQENVQANLISLVDRLSSYLKFYQRSYTILYPVYFVLGLLFGGLERGADEFFENLVRPRTIVLLILIGSLFYFISTRFTDWYLQKLYGNHLQKLKGLLNDIQG